MSDWIKCETRLPPDGEIVETKIDDANGCRNEQSLKLKGNLWWFSDDSMYVYYYPTHWKPASEATKSMIRDRAVKAAELALEHAKAM